MAAATGAAHASTPRDGGSTSTTVPPHAFADALRTGDLKALDATLAPNIRFYTPVLATPVVGRERASRLLAVLVATFQDRHITARIHSRRHYALAFDAHIGTQPIEIFDLITFDRTGHIVKFVSHGRPLAGVQALGAAVAPHLAEILGG